MSNTKRKNGFTLIELLATIAVLSVVITLVIYFSITIMDKSRNKSYQVTINNVEKVASNYIIENVNHKAWIDSNDGDYQYQCITVQDLIDAGYFKSDVLDSMVSKQAYLRADDSVYIERDVLSKTITKNILLVGEAEDYGKLCNEIKVGGNINVSVRPSSWSNNKVVTVRYNLSNYDKLSNYKYSYIYKLADGSVSKNISSKFTNTSRVETFSVDVNGTLIAKIIDSDGNEIVSKSFVVNKIDNKAPIVLVNSANEIASKQMVTLSMSDNGSGIKSYYIGKDNPELVDVEWKDILSDDVTEDSGPNSFMVEREVDTNGIWYFGAMDGSGNKTVVYKKFYFTKLVIENASIENDYILTMDGDKLAIPVVKVNQGYEFNGWYSSSSYDDFAIIEYKPATDGTLYGKTELKIYTVMLDSNGATTNGTESVKVTYGNIMPNIIVPKRSGYSFDGYYSTKNAIDMSYSSNSMTSSIWRVNFLKDSNGWLKTTEDVGTHVQIAMTLKDSTISSAPTLDFNDVSLVNGTDYYVSGGNGTWIYYIDFDITEKMVSARNYNYDTNYRFIDINNLSSNGSVSIGMATKGGKKYYNNNGEGIWNYDVYGNTTLYAKWVDLAAPVVSDIIYTSNLFPTKDISSYSSLTSVSGNSITSKGNDPYIIFSGLSITDVTKAIITLEEGSPINTTIQVFYATSGTSFSEANSARTSIAKGDKIVKVDLPGGTYTAIRFDFGSTSEVTFKVKGIDLVGKNISNVNYVHADITDVGSKVSSYAVTTSSTKPSSFTDITDVSNYHVRYNASNTVSETYYVWGKDGLGNISLSLNVKGTKTLLDKMVSLGATSYTYDGSAKLPTVTVKDGVTSLTKDTHYTISYSNNVNAGTATVTVTGKGLYSGTVSRTFKIEKGSCTCAISSYTTTMKYPESTSGKVEYSCGGDGTISVASNNANIITVGSIGSSSTTLTAKEIGSSTITVSRGAGSNYNACTSDSEKVSVAASQYVVSYNANGGSGTMSSGTATYGSSFTIAANSFTAPKGHKFNAWSVSSSATDSNGWTGWSGNWVYKNGQYGISDNKLNLYAIWSKKNFAVSYSCGTGTGTAPSAQSITYGSKITVAGNTCSKKGYTFSTWTTNSNETNDGHGWAAGWSGAWNYDNGDYGIANDKLQLYPVWTPKTYTISYSCGTGTGTAPSNQSATFGTSFSKIASNTCSKKGYIFDRWTTNSNETNDGYGWTAGWGGTWSFDNGDYGIANNKLQLYPVWKINTYTVTLDRQGGTTGSTSVTTTYGNAMPSITVPSRAGYTFLGYYSNKTAFDLKYGVAGSNYRRIELNYLENDWGMTKAADSGKHIQGKIILVDSSLSSTPIVQFSDLSLTNGTHYKVTAASGTYTYYLDFDITDEMVSKRGSYDYEKDYRFIDFEGGGVSSSTKVTVSLLTVGGKKYYSSSGASLWNYDIDGNTTLYAKWVDTTEPTTPSIITMYDIYGSRTQNLQHMTQNGNSYTTTGKDPYINYSNIDGINGINGAYVGLSSGAPADTSFQVFYEASGVSLNESHSNRDTLTKGGKQLYIPFTNSGTWVKVRYDFGGTSGLTYAVSNLAVAATANQWNRDDIILRLSTSDSGSGIAYWQYTYSSSATMTGTDDTTSWVTFNNSNSSTFIPGAFTATRNQLVYVRACDDAGNCSQKASTYIKIDKSVPTASITSNGGTSIKLTYGDNNGVVSYYFGTTNPSSSNVTYTSISSTTSGTQTKTVTTTGTYYLSVKDIAGNITTTSVSITTLTGTFNYYKGQSTTVQCNKIGSATSCSLTAPSALGTPSGYSFRGWSTSPNANAAIGVLASGTVTLNDNMSFYGSYSKTVTATFRYSTLTSDNYTYNNHIGTTKAVTGTEYMNYAGGIDTATGKITIPNEVKSSKGGAAAENYVGLTTLPNSSTTVISATESTVPATTATYYAIYTENLTFYYYNGSSHTNMAVVRRMLFNGTSYNTSLDKAVPSSSAYDSANYVGWSYTDSSINVRQPLETGVNALYAYYQKTITVTYNANGGSGAPSSQTGTKTYISKNGGVNTLSPNITLSSTIPTRNSYVFSKWNTKTDGTGTSYTNGTAYTFENNTTLYAIWTANTYMVTIKAGNGISKVALSGWTNTGTGTMTKALAYGSTLDLSKITPTYKTGYSGVSYVKTSGSGSLSGSTFTVGSGVTTITLSATTLAAPVPSISTTSTTKIYGASATTLTATQSTSYDSAVKVYYKFGNSTSSAGTYSYGNASTVTTSSVSATSHYGTKYYKVQAYATDGTLTSSTATWGSSMYVTLRGAKIALYANNCGVISGGVNPFYTRSGLANRYTTETGTTAATFPSFYEKTGYTFNGWYTEASGGSKVLNADGALTGTAVSGYSTTSVWQAIEDKVLYAQCSANKYVVAYTMNGATSMPSSTQSYNIAFYKTNPTKKFVVNITNSASGTLSATSSSSSQKFIGWTYKNGSTSTAVYGTSSDAVTTAWSSSTTKVIATYFKNLRTSSGTVEMIANWDPVDVTLPTITKSGHTCGYTEIDGGTSIMYESGGSYNPSATDASVTLYTVCESNAYTVTIKAGNGISKVSLSGWINTGTGMMTKTLAYGSKLDLSKITPTYKSGYSGVSYVKTSGSGSLSGSTFTVGAGATTITLNATTLAAPVPSISTTSTTKIYGASATTLTATQSTSYDSAVKVYYKFGNSTSSAGTYSYGNASTVTTSSVSATSHYGTKYYKVQAYATDGTLTSSTATWGSSMYVTLRGAKITLYANNCGVISGGVNPFYTRSGLSNRYTTETGTTAATFPGFTVNTGYTFNGWYTEASGGSKILTVAGALTGTAVSGYSTTSAWAAKEDKTLYAQCTPNTYTITYKLGNAKSTAGATDIGTSTCTYGTDCTLKSWSELGKTFPNTYTSASNTWSTGWSFEGWSTSSTGTSVNYTNSQKFSYNITSNLTLYAIGSRKFEFYSGIAPTSIFNSQVQYWNPYSTSSSYLTEITIPTPIEISGWTAKDYCTNNETNYSSCITMTSGTITPSYMWKVDSGFRTLYGRTLTISYKGNNSTGGTTNSSTATQLYNSGYASNGSNVGANVSTPTFTLASNGFSKTGYSFSKWADGNTNGTQYAAGEEYSNWTPAVDDISVTKSMYAIWTANTYSIEYKLNDGTAGSSAPTSATYGSNVTISNPTKIGYTFKGWTYENGDTSTAKYYAASNSITPTAWSSSTTKITATKFLNLRSSSGTVILTANWADETAPTGILSITDGKNELTSSGGTLYGNNIIANIGSVIEYGDGVESYLFGIAKDASTCEEVLMDNKLNASYQHMSLLTSGTYTVCAVIKDVASNYSPLYSITFTLVSKYNVTYNSGDLIYGRGDVSSTTGGNANFTYSISNDVVTATAGGMDSHSYVPYRVYLETGKTYKFNATSSGTWGEGAQTQAFLMLDGQYDTYYHMAGNSDYEFTVSVTGVYWLRLDANNTGETHTFSNISISYDIDTKEVEYGSVYGAPPFVSKNGYSLSGWYTSMTGGDKVSNTTIMNETKNHTLYARWNVNKVSIKYSVNGGSITSPTYTSDGSTTYTWTTDSSGIISRSTNGGTSTDSFMTIEHMGTLPAAGLINYDNINYTNITRSGYYVVSNAEWVCLSGDCTVGKIYNDTTVYAASDFCDTSYSSCTAVLGVNWVIKNNTIPIFKYDGESYCTSNKCTIVDDNDNKISNPSSWTGDWKVRFTEGKDTVLEFIEAPEGIDIFVVGGGGAGAEGAAIYRAQQSLGASGGGGGSSVTVLGFIPKVSTLYNLTIGTGGTTNSNASNSLFKVGGQTCYTGNAGSNGNSPYFNGSAWQTTVVGIGGAKGTYSSDGVCAAKFIEGWNGSDGGRPYRNDSEAANLVQNGKIGTIEFNGSSETGKIYYGAGGGSGGFGASQTGGGYHPGFAGGNTGGGTGGQGCSVYGSCMNGSTKVEDWYGGYMCDAVTGGAADANTGSGGGGGGGTCGTGNQEYKSYYNSFGGNGASGIIVIRNTREIPTYPVTYNLNYSDSYSSGEYLDTGYKLNFDEDFTIETTFKIPSAGNRYLIFGDYASNVATLNVEVTTNNALRVYMSNGNVNKSSGTVVANENINLKFIWDASENTYSVTAIGSSTNISFSGTYDVSGKATNPLRIGTADNRGSSVFSDITISAFKITKPHAYGKNLSDLPTASKVGSTFNGWYTASSGGSQVTTVSIMNSKSAVTYYGRWTIHKVTIKYNVNGGNVIPSTTSGTNTYSWSIDDSGMVYRAVNGGASELVEVRIAHGESLGTNGLANWDNFITRAGYYAPEGAEYVCLSGNCTVGKTYSDSKVYSASDFCNTSSGSCYVVLGVNWKASTNIKINLLDNSHSFFRNGSGYDYALVGTAAYDYSVRYSFKTTSEQSATSVKLTFRPANLEQGTKAPDLRFYIGTDSTSHMHANGNSVYTGTLVQYNESYYSGYPDINQNGYLYLKLEGSANINILPNTTYYVWVFGNGDYGGYRFDIGVFDAFADIVLNPT